jgi:type II secretory pathway component PulF
MTASRTISLDDLIALNDEIIALTRAGVPLDRGLQMLGGELPGRFGGAARGLGERLEAGQSLEQALDATSGGRLPEVYLAVVRAGMKAGRLPAALEGLAVAARRARQLRRAIGLALVYPVIVLLLAYALLVLAFRFWIPELIPFYESFHAGVPGIIRWLSAVGESAPRWAAIPPLLAMFAGVAWWFWNRDLVRRATGSAGARRGRGLVGTLRDGRLAGFAEVLALLIEQQVPLPESLLLAADASGDRALRHDVRELVERLVRGETPRPGDSSPGTALGSLPPLMRWLILSSQPAQQLADSLRRLSRSYHARAKETADWYSLYLPLWLTAGIGGTAVATYAILIFAPWCDVLTRIGYL